MKVVDAVKSELKMPNLKVNLQPVTSTQPHSAAAERHHRPGMRFDHQQRRAAEAGCVRSDLLRDQRDRGREEELEHQELADLKGKTISTTSGTTAVPLLKKYEKTKNADIKEIYGKDHAESFLLLSQDRTAAFVMDDILLAGQIANSSNPGDYMILTGESLRTEPYSMMLRKDDPQFKALVDKTVGGIMKSGEINQIYAKWFTSPIPPKNINLNFPPTPAIKEAFANPNDKGV